MHSGAPTLAQDSFIHDWYGIRPGSGPEDVEICQLRVALTSWERRRNSTGRARSRTRSRRVFISKTAAIAATAFLARTGQPPSTSHFLGCLGKYWAPPGNPCRRQSRPGVSYPTLSPLHWLLPN